MCAAIRHGPPIFGGNLFFFPQLTPSMTLPPRLNEDALFTCIGGQTSSTGRNGSLDMVVEVCAEVAEGCGGGGGGWEGGTWELASAAKATVYSLP